MTNIDAEAKEFIASLVKEGFMDEEDIIEEAIYYFEENDLPTTFEQEVERLTSELLAVHREEQKTWGAVTDCDRLDRAFESLNAQGIIARQHFACCNNCGYAEIGEQIEEEEENQTVQGFVFYHSQSTETAAAEGKLYLTYGSIEESEQAMTRVAEQCVAELRRAGLNASWEGDCGKAIVVDDIVWRKRRAEVA